MKNIINVTINGKILTGYKGETILQLAKRHNIYIPTLCHDDRLEPYSSCFLCVVDIKGEKTLQTSCSTTIREGMELETDNERVRLSRKTALELLLSNHYADCMAPCQQTCPAGVDVQGYISLIEKGKYSDAVQLIKEVNPLPAICGRVCVRPCEVACRRNFLNEGAAVGIDYLKRFAADADLASLQPFRPKIEPHTGKKVAVIGAGPGGLSVAYFLQQKGHQVDIFEANSFAGGMLRYGIPEYRLPNNLLDNEIKQITNIGVQIFYNQQLGNNLIYKELKEKYQALVLTIGSQSGTSVGCDGDDAQNVFSGIDFLRTMEVSGKKFDFTGKKVAVVGGGNTAMDCCRTAIRCGAEKVYVIYRRTEKEMPANPIEIHESKIEGVEYLLLTNPVKINKKQNGEVESVTLLRMELGEPDKSGRRKPVPIENSEFDLELDYILAAIGQKTVVTFLDDINQHVTEGKLQLNRWGDIDADRKTLQTGVPSIFAAGDGVTGPATLIEAIAQAKIAALSCHQFLMNEVIKPISKEFLSKKENFKKQETKDYFGKFATQRREEIPVLPADKRLNFNEVELGYSKEAAHNEVERCLECGCVEYFSCKLKKLATEYQIDQKHYEGDFQERTIDFSHPYIEIDNNKCILCSRCIRICNEVVGANALGLVKRGFDTFVAPALGNSLTETDCESCGLCISTCPTAAISENVKFKSGAFKTQSFRTISNFGGVGEAIEIHHHNGFVMKVSGTQGFVNNDGNIGRELKFGYNYLNDNERIKKPLLNKDGVFEEISFEEAFNLIYNKIKATSPDKNIFTAGARLTNEEQYLIQKLARAGVKTNNIGSFYYMAQGNGYRNNSLMNVPLNELNKATKIYLIGSETNEDDPYVNFLVNQARKKYHIPVELVTMYEDSSMKNKVDEIHYVESYYYFVKALNYFFIENSFYNQLYIRNNCENFDTYSKFLLKENFAEIVEKSGIANIDALIDFAKDFNSQHGAVIIFSEREVSANTSTELRNLAMLTGKLGKTASGLIALKEKNNAQGLLDMGISPEYFVGNQFINNQVSEELQQFWKTDFLTSKINNDLFSFIQENCNLNLFIFGEDPLGCAVEVSEIEDALNNVDFLVVQDYFLTETAKTANLILPASLPFEIGGSFTNSLKIIQQIDKVADFQLSPEFDSYSQLFQLLQKFGFDNLNSLEDVTNEIIALLSKAIVPKRIFETTPESDYNRMFEFGCDVVIKRFEEEFDRCFGR